MANTLESTIDGAVKDSEIVRKEGMERKERLINSFARVTQFLTWPFLFVIFHVLFRIKITGRRNFRAVRDPFIIISNHISFYDSFLFRLVLGFSTPHLPLRFMAVTKFNWRFLNFLASLGVIEFIYSLFGVFTITPGLGIDKNLEKAKEIIRVGGNVVIFPEGKIYIPDAGSTSRIGPFKKGAAVLMMATGAAVIPVAFSITSHWFRRRIDINVGGPMNILPGLSVEEITNSFHESMEVLIERS